jgi:O-antigen/teichoic acid export membrane protein
MIKRNIKYLIGTYFIRAVLNIFIFFLLARLLNITDYGILSFGFALSMLITSFSEYGYSLMLIRDINQSKYDKNIQISNMYLQKILLTFIVILLASLYIYFNFFNTIYFEISCIFLLYATINSFVMFNNAIFKAYQKFEYELQIALSQLIVVLIGMIFLFLFDSLDIVFLSLLFVVSRFISYIYTFRFLNFMKIKINFKKNFDISYNKYLFFESFLFGLHAIFATVYLQFDTQVIATYLTVEDVANYQNLFKTIMIFGILSEIIGFAYLPKLSKLYIDNYQEYIRLISKINYILIAITLFSFTIFYLFKDFFITLMYSDKYSEISNYLIFILVVIVLRVLNFIFGTHLSLSKFQKQRAISVILTVSFGVIASLYIIPHYGFVGALYNMIFVHLLLFGFYFYYTLKLTNELIFLKR